MAAFYIFLLVYSFGVDVAGVVFYSELFPNHIRSKGVSLCMVSIALTDLVYLQATSSAFANIGWKFFLVCRCPPLLTISLPSHFLPTSASRQPHLSAISKPPSPSRFLTLTTTQVFIIIMAVGIVWAIKYLPETKGRTLEEMAVIFGDDEDVVVLLKDIHVDHTTHQVVAEREKRRIAAAAEAVAAKG